VFKPEKTDSIKSVLQWIIDFPMWAFLLVLELVGAVIKAFALTIRLFANMVAGHVVLAALLGLILVVKGSVALYAGIGGVTALGAATLSLLELFVCFLQAYVFTFLTTLFIGASVSPEH
jgi:F-type H+-transporting ATPase subunit a